MKKHNEVRGLYNNLVLLAGPSAGGKDTASNILVSDFGYKRLITTTTRPMRDGEINDVTYHFVNEHAFLDLLKKRKLLETIEFCNNLYGLNVEEIENFSKGPDKVGVLILTPSGIKAVEDYVKEHNLKKLLLTKVFIDVSLNEQLNRLNQRLNNDEALVRERIKSDMEEIRTTVVVNYNLIVNSSLQSPLTIVNLINEYVVHKDLTEGMDLGIKEKFLKD